MTEVNVTINPAGDPKFVDDEPVGDRVSLAPLEPADALRALLATPPQDQD